MHVRLLFAVVALCFVLTWPGALRARNTVPGYGIRSPFPGITYRELRYEEVIGQTDWYTCGPAAAATLLHFYYDLQVDEAALLERSLEAMAAQGQDPAGGISALALVRAMADYGFSTPGYRLTPGELEDYFRNGGLPLILHVTFPQPHYIVGIGLVGHHLVAADPSWGRRIEPMQRFLEEKAFSGVVLLPLPPEDLMVLGQARQARSLESAAERLHRLHVEGRAGR